MPNYEYIEIDPKALKMMGDDSQLLNEELSGDIPSVPDIQPTNKWGVEKVPSGEFATPAENPTALLGAILKELKEIKVILAGR